MSVREIKFTFDEKGILPETVQFGGVQFEDNATLVRYTLSDSYKQKLHETYQSAEFIYRIDFNSLIVGYHPSENLCECEGSISRTIPISVTRGGEQFQSVLVITVINQNGEVLSTISSPPSRIYLTAVSRDFSEELQISENLSAIERKVEQLTESAINSSNKAIEKAESAQETLLETQHMVSSLENISYLVYQKAEETFEYSKNAEAAVQRAEEAFDAIQDELIKNCQEIEKTAQAALEKSQEANLKYEDCVEATENAERATEELEEIKREIAQGGYISGIKESNQGTVLSFWVGSKAEYDALEEKAQNRFHIITDDTTAEEQAEMLLSLQNSLSESRGKITDLENSPRVIEMVTTMLEGIEWVYKKWSNGLAECWAKLLLTTKQKTIKVPITFTNPIFIGVNMNAHVGHTYAPEIYIGAGLENGNELIVAANKEIDGEYAISVNVMGVYQV